MFGMVLERIFSNLQGNHQVNFRETKRVEIINSVVITEESILGAVSLEFIEQCSMETFLKVFREEYQTKFFDCIRRELERNICQISSRAIWTILTDNIR